MSLATLESEIFRSARTAFKNSKIRLKDIMEWSTGEIKPHEGEVVAWIPDPGVWVAIRKELDKRGC